MKKIIDSNFFRDPELETYRSSDKGNIVVFNDFACMESYKGDALKNVSNLYIPLKNRKPKTENPNLDLYVL